MGADTVVLHAGRVMFGGFLRRWDMKRRVKRGKKMIDIFKGELEQIVPELEQNKVTLALENLPYLEGFPAEWEMQEVVGDWVKPWLDTGHDFVRRQSGWTEMPPAELKPWGLHINDSNGGDDHLPPGEGKVDFAGLKTIAETARHLVLEPHADVTEEALKASVEFLRKTWAA